MRDKDAFDERAVRLHEGSVKAANAKNGGLLIEIQLAVNKMRQIGERPGWLAEEQSIMRSPVAGSERTIISFLTAEARRAATNLQSAGRNASCQTVG